jgi:ABC-type phosphate transport system substrate-binding protein
MKKSILHLLLGAALFSAPVPAEVTVVANSSVGASEISADDLKRVFLGAKSSLSDGSAVEPVLQQAGATHEAFLKEYVGKTDAALRNHFKSLVFTGKGSMPKSFGSDADIVAYVARTKGAIGYVGNAAAATGVKRIAVK